MPADCGIDRSGVFFGFINKLLLTEPIQRRTEEKKNQILKTSF